MANCINTNHPNFQKMLLEAGGINPLVLKAKMGAWMDENNTLEWPTLEQLGIKNVQNVKVHDTTEIIYQETPEEKFLKLFKINRKTEYNDESQTFKSIIEKISIYNKNNPNNKIFAQFNTYKKGEEIYRKFSHFTGNEFNIAETYQSEENIREEILAEIEEEINNPIQAELAFEEKEVVDMDSLKEKVEGKLSSFFKNLGINIESLPVYDSEGTPLPFIAKSDLVNKTIQVVQNKRDITTLPEEAGHIFVNLLPRNGDLLKRMRNIITTTSLYNRVVEENKNNPEFINKDGSLDETGLKDEAIGQAIGQFIISQTVPTNIRFEESSSNPSSKFIEGFNNLFKKVYNLLSQLFENAKTEYAENILNDFKAAAIAITNGDISKLVDVNEAIDHYNESKERYIFYQLTNENKAIDLLNRETAELNSEINRYVKNGKTIKNRVSSLVSQTAGSFFKKKISRENNEKAELAAQKGDVYHMHMKNIMDKIHSEWENGVNDVNKLYNQIYDSINEIEAKTIRDLKNNPDKKWAIGKPDEFFYISKGKTRRYAINALLVEAFTMYSDALKFQQTINKQTGTNGKFKMYTEKVIISEKKDAGGTIDVLFVFSNNYATKYDYKTTGRSEEMANYKQLAYQVQQSIYSEILKSEYGVEGFYRDRILPIHIQYDSNGITEGINTFSTSRWKNKDFLEQIPSPFEELNLEDKKKQEFLQKQLRILQNQRKKIIEDVKQAKSVEEKTRKHLRLKIINETIKKVQLNKDIQFVIDEMNGILTEYNNRLVLPNDHADTLTFNDLKDYEDHFNILKSILPSTIENVEDDMKDMFHIINSKFNLALESIETTRVQLLKDQLGEDFDPSAPVKALGPNPMFKSLSSYTRQQFQALKKIIDKNTLTTREFVIELGKELKIKTNDLESWAKSNGHNLKWAFEQLYNEQTGRLYAKNNSEYYDELKNAQKDKNYDWVLKNTDVIKTKLGFKFSDEEKQKKWEDYKNRTIEFYKANIKGFNREQKIKEAIQSWEEQNDFTKHKEAVFNTWLKPKEIWYSEQYKFINSNKPLKDYYDFYIETTREFEKLIGRPLKSGFVAEIKKEALERMMRNGVLGIAPNFFGNINDYLKISEYNDEQDNRADDGTLGLNIPLLYVNPIREHLSPKEIRKVEEEIIQEEGKPKDLISDFQDKVNQKVYELERDKGLNLKSMDLSNSLSLLAQSVMTYHTAISSIDAVNAIRSSFNYAQTIQTNRMGKTITTTSPTGEKEISMVKGIENPRVAKEVELFDKYIRMYFYGQSTQSQDSKIGKYSLNRIIKAMVRYNGLRMLGLSVPVAFGSAANATSQMLIKASEGRIFTGKDLKNGVKIVIGKSEQSDKYEQVSKILGLVAKDRIKKERQGLSYNKSKKFLKEENFYLLMSEPDRGIENITAAAILSGFTIRDGSLKKMQKGETSILDMITIENGKLKGVSDKHLSQIKTLIQREYSGIKGSLSETDQDLLNTNIWIYAGMQFKRWMNPLLLDRFKRTQFDPILEDFDSGRFRILWEDLVVGNLQDKINVFRSTLMEVIPYVRANRYKSERWKALAKKQFDNFLSENSELEILLEGNEEMYNQMFEEFVNMRIRKLKGVATEIRLILAVVAMMLLGSAVDDDDDDNYFFKLYNTLWQRAYRELSFYFDPYQLVKSVSIPLTSLPIDAFDLVGETVNTSRLLLFGKMDDKDKTMITRKFSNFVPGFKPFAKYLYPIDNLIDAEINEALE